MLFISRTISLSSETATELAFLFTARWLRWDRRRLFSSRRFILTLKNSPHSSIRSAPPTWPDARC